MEFSRPTSLVAVLTIFGFTIAPAAAGDHDGAHLDAASATEIVKMLDEHKMTLAKALDKAEYVSGGRAFSVAPRMGKGMLHISMYAIEGEELWDVEINEKGSLLQSGAQKPAADDKPAQERFATGKTARAAMDEAKMTFARAIEAAEKHSKGRAVVAAAVLADKTAMICVHCLVGDKMSCCQVAMDGKVTDAPTAHAEKKADAPKAP